MTTPLASHGGATCPACHTIDSTTTVDAVSNGAAWHCARCGQQWSGSRLATVAGYAAWLDARATPRA